MTLASSRRPIGTADGSDPDQGGGLRSDPDHWAFIGVVAIKLTSDHTKKLTDQGFHKPGQAKDRHKDFEAGGKPFPANFTWIVDPLTGKSRSHPVSHTKGKTVTLEVTVLNEHIRSVRAKVVGKVFGTDVPRGMRFESEHKVFAPGSTSLTIESTEPLPNEVKALWFRVRWTLYGSVSVMHHIPSAPHKEDFVSENEILITVREPKVANADDLTYARMAHAVEKAAAVGATAAHAMVDGLVNSVKFSGTITSEAWFFARNPGKAADCITIAKYVQELLKLLGIDGDSSAVIVYVRPNSPLRWQSIDPADAKVITGFPAPQQIAKLRLLDPITLADFRVIEDPSPATPGLAGLNWPSIWHSTEPWFLRLVDHSGGRNNYEGCVKFTDAAKVTRWYPAGTGLSGLESPKEVIKRVFKSLSWVEGDTVRADLPGAMSDIKAK